MNKNKGFTLIELLVVIAIIVILAMIVFPGVQTATKKARDARIVSELSQIRTQAEMWFTDKQTYTGMAADPSITKLINDINAQAKPTTPVAPEISSDGSTYRVVTPLTSPGAGNACIDSNSSTYTGTAALPTDGTCPVATTP